MTITSNIVIGVPAWTSSTSYPAGVLATNSGNAYQVITAGTSAASGGPAGTGAGIVDGTVVWNFLCSVDYTSLQTWANGIVTPLTQPVIGQVLAAAGGTGVSAFSSGFSPGFGGASSFLPGFINIGTGGATPYLTLSGHTTSPSNNITVKPLPGFGVADVFGPASSTNPFYFSSSLGCISFVAPANPATAINYFQISDANVVFDGFLFQDNSATGQCSMIAVLAGGGGFRVQNCIFDGFAQTGGAAILDFEDQTTMVNCLIVDHQPAANTNPPVFFLSSANNCHAVNNTLIKLNGESGGTTTAIDWDATTGALFRNNAVFGYASPFSGSGGTATADHNVTDALSLGSGSPTQPTDNGGNQLNKISANQFIQSGFSGSPWSVVFSQDFGPFTISQPDFRIKSGGNLVNAGVPDTVDIPTSTDFAGHRRVEWDAGAWALLQSTVAVSNLLTIACSATAVVSTLTNNITTVVSVEVLTAAIAMVQQNQISGAPTVLRLTAVASSQQVDQASTARTVLALTPAITVRVNLLASQSGTLPALSSNSAMQVPYPAAGTASILALTASGLSVPPASFVGTSNVLVLSAAGQLIPILNFSAANNFDISPLIRADQFNSLSAAPSFFALVSSISLGQVDIATAVATISITAAGAVGSSASGRSSLFAISASVSAVLSDNAFATLLAVLKIGLLAPSPIGLLADANGSPVLKADANGSPVLMADLAPIVNLTSDTTASGQADLFDIQAIVSAIQSLAMSSTDDVIDLAVTTATAVQQDLALASVAFFGVRSAIQLGQSRNVSGSASFFNLHTATSSATGSNPVSATAGVLGLSAIVAMGGSNPVNAADTVMALTVTNGTSGPTLMPSGRASFFMLAAVGAAINSNGVDAVITIPLVAAAAITQQDNTSASNPVFVLAAVGMAQQADLAQAADAVMALTCSASMSSATKAQGIASIAISAAGNVTNFVEQAAGSGSALALTCAGTAVVNGSNMECLATVLPLSCTALIGGFVTATATAYIETVSLVTAHAWQTPVGFVDGDDVVWWPA